MKKLKYFLPVSFALLFLLGMTLPVQAQGSQSTIISHQAGSTQPPQIVINTSADCFALSNEAPGDLVSKLDTAGYGNYNLYELLASIRTITNPSVAGIITDQFLATLLAEPANAETFTTQLKNIDTPGITVEICTNGTVQTVPVSGYLAAQSFPTLVSNLSGVGAANFTHTTETSGDIATWDVTNIMIKTTYHIFGVAWGVGEPLHMVYLPLVVK